MALDNFANLKATIIRHDGSSSITDIMDVCVLLAEEEMYSNPTNPLQVRVMEITTTSAASTTVATLALPTGYTSMRRIKLKLDNSDQDILYATPESMQSYTAAGRPRYFTVTDTIEFDRVADSAYNVEIQHYAKPTALSDTNTTNVILTNFPSIYLYGCLWVVNQFNAEEEKAGYYYQVFMNAIRGANNQDRRGRHGPAPAMRQERMIP